ncbi:hypothetical protein EDF85_2421 [Pseudomonas putida]|uniref:Uncharacterized protein n=1 Tax=Pseudomonas putida TaxID=303 RepID=A0A9X8EKK7_PSEPU|nr:hypothetical protein EDF85_2421 [Pseudomonas putida]
MGTPNVEGHPLTLKTLKWYIVFSQFFQKSI